MAKRDSNSNNKILILRLTLFEDAFVGVRFEELVQVAAAARLHHRTAAAGKSSPRAPCSTKIPPTTAR